ncbi:50S ribosomal protein L6 [archaeon]|jgi:large subunit ribosomal protein L6|nr:50S ribosomal protein L6 [archaeon]
MKKELFQEIEIPEGVEITLNDGEVAVKGKEGELKRTFNVARIIFEKKDNKIIIGNKKATKTEKKLMNSITAHIKNMILGVQNKFEYKLKICFSHFPFTVDIQGNVATIKNFLGEKINRKCIIPKDADVKINKQEITVTAINKEIAGQAAANFENATKIRNRDKRVFQDGIYITEKNGKLM